MAKSVVQEHSAGNMRSLQVKQRTFQLHRTDQLLLLGKCPVDDGTHGQDMKWRGLDCNFLLERRWSWSQDEVFRRLDGADSGVDIDVDGMLRARTTN